MAAYHWEITTDPNKPCKETRVIESGLARTAIKKAILAGHDWLTEKHIGEIERVFDRGDITHVVTIKTLPTDHPRNPMLARFDWLNTPGVAFWVECISKRVMKRKDGGR